MKRILICEDEDTIREFVVINLKRAGYDVVDVNCGEAALKTFEQEHGNFDIVLLDIMMPGIDGFTVCKKIREKSSTIGIIMLTARTQEMDKVSGLMIGADDYITKPFSPTELLARVDSLYRRVEMYAPKVQVNPSDDITLGDFTLNLEFFGDSEYRDCNYTTELTVDFEDVEYHFDCCCCTYRSWCCMPACRFVYRRLTQPHASAYFRFRCRIHNGGW